MLLKLKFSRSLFASCFARWLAIGLAMILVQAAIAENLVLHLKGGDQISGTLISESTNNLVISNAWAGVITVPVLQVATREIETNGPASSTVLAVAPGSAKVEPPKITGTNNPAATLTVAKTTPTKPKRYLHGQVNVGLDSLVSETSQQNYYGKLSLTYLRPYQSRPKEFFRNTTQASAQYQRTGDQVSANQANASDKTDFDFDPKNYGYSGVSAGYDEVRKIDLQYQVGPGLGRHLVRTDRTAFNVESGVDYETQYRRDADNLESFFLRLAEDWDWQIVKNLKLTEKLEFYPNLEPVNAGQYHFDFTSTLSYGFWQNLSLDLTLDDSYNTQVAQGVQRNEFAAHLSLGAKF